MYKIINKSLITTNSIPTLKNLYTTPKQEILISNQQKIKPNPTCNEMKTAHKISKEGKRKKKDQLKSTHTQPEKQQLTSENNFPWKKSYKAKFFVTVPS